MTQSQTKLNIEEKGKNVAGAFQPHEGLTDIENIRHIIRVDDVFTTGSTLHACFEALRTVFPSSVRISVVALGFVGEA